MGQVRFSSSHWSMQLLWNWCLQGKFLTTSPTLKRSIQTAQVSWTSGTSMSSIWSVAVGMTARARLAWLHKSRSCNANRTLDQDFGRAEWTIGVGNGLLSYNWLGFFSLAYNHYCIECARLPLFTHFYIFYHIPIGFISRLGWHFIFHSPKCLTNNVSLWLWCAIFATTYLSFISDLTLPFIKGCRSGNKKFSINCFLLIGKIFNRSSNFAHRKQRTMSGTKVISGPGYCVGRVWWISICTQFLYR